MSCCLVGANNHSPSRAAGTSKTIGSVVRGYKIGVTKWFQTGVNNDARANDDSPLRVGGVWQRNYWDHIIRNEDEYHRISQYIIDNPLTWENDKLNGGAGNVVMETQAQYNSKTWML